MVNTVCYGIPHNNNNKNNNMIKYFLITDNKRDYSKALKSLGSKVSPCERLTDISQLLETDCYPEVIDFRSLSNSLSDLAITPTTLPLTWKSNNKI